MADPLTREEIAALQAKHRRYQQPPIGSEWCRYCEDSWPCPTTRALASALALIELRERIATLANDLEGASCTLGVVDPGEIQDTVPVRRVAELLRALLTAAKEPT